MLLEVRMKTLKRVDVGSLAIMYGAIGAALGLIAALLLLVFGGMMSGLGGNNVPGLGAGVGIVGIIVFPLIYGIGGLIGGALTAVFYNLFAGVVGGVKIEIE